MKIESTSRTGLPQLAQLQSWFFERVTRLQPPPGSSDGPERWPLARLVSSGGLPALERLEIYRHAYVARLVECLQDDYPALAQFLGEPVFEHLCRDFIAEHPPRSPSLNFYGALLPQFVEQRGAEWSAFASDLARLEWAIVEAIHAEASATLDVDALEQLSAVDWPSLRLLPSPALRLIEARYPLLPVYRSLLDGNVTSLPAPEPALVAVCRAGDAIWRLSIEPALGGLLRRLIAGEPLLVAIEAIRPEPTLDATALLQRALRDWVASGFFCDAVTRA